MKSKFLIILAIMTVACWAGAASATIITFNTAPGATVTVNGNVEPVSATATFTTTTGTIDILMANTLINPHDAGQVLSGLSFVLSNTFTGGALASSLGTRRTITSTAVGGYTDGGVSATGWGFSTPTTTSIRLDGLAGDSNPQASGTIIGPPGATDAYSDANASLLVGSHNPFLFGGGAPVEFLITGLFGITDATTITSVNFSFSTAAGHNVPGEVPIPPTALLLGSGLLGLALLGLRRRRADRRFHRFEPAGVLKTYAVFSEKSVAEKIAKGKEVGSLT
jgi:hypothetical protein